MTGILWQGVVEMKSYSCSNVLSKSVSLSQAPSLKVQQSSKICQTLHLFASKHSLAEEWQLRMNLEVGVVLHDHQQIMFVDGHVCKLMKKNHVIFSICKNSLFGTCEMGGEVGQL